MKLTDFLALCCWAKRAGRPGHELRAIARRLPTLLLAFAARRRRAWGRYDATTLAMFWLLWRRKRTAAALVDYLIFRRDLGHAAPTHYVDILSSRINELRASRRWLATCLLGEARGRYPALPQSSTLTPPASGMELWLQRIQSEQPRWRDDFASVLRRQRARGICVVGNAGHLLGAGVGSAIDDNGMVIRFNRYRHLTSRDTDIGSRISVWVGAPNYRGSPNCDVPWIVVSGPDVRFRRRDWSALRPALEKGTPILTVPLPVWCSLVRRLHAPPSAGLLMLAWLRELQGGWLGISAAGFGLGGSGSMPYHHADPAQRPSARHNWAGELALLQLWRQEGLQLLTSERQPALQILSS